MIANIRSFANRFTLWFQIFRTKGGAYRNTIIVIIAVFADFYAIWFVAKKT